MGTHFIEAGYQLGLRFVFRFLLLFLHQFDFGFAFSLDSIDLLMQLVAPGLYAFMRFIDF